MLNQIIAGNGTVVDDEAWLRRMSYDGNGVAVTLINTGHDTGDDGAAHLDLCGCLILDAL